MWAIAARNAALASKSPLLSSSCSRGISTIATKYSNAVYKAALSKSPQTLSKVQTELSAISSSIKEVPQLGAFVSNPLISGPERLAGLEALYKASASKGAKEPVSDITRNLFAVLAENGRLGETLEVIEGFNELVAKYKGELDVIVTSASPLPRDVLSKLESTLKQSEAAKQAKVVRVTNKVNPSVLGGILVDVGDKTIDLSVSSRVSKLNSLLQQSI